jgi:phospholipid/cholesterol/gamma-HCH transport system substrate-binding protein
MRRGRVITCEQVRVSAVVLVALIILLFGGYRLGKVANLFTENYELVAFVPNATGLRVGGAVTVAGQLAGTAQAIDFLPVDADTTRTCASEWRWTSGSCRRSAPTRARLRTQGLLGDKVFDISPRTLRASRRDRHDGVRRRRRRGRPDQRPEGDHRRDREGRRDDRQLVANRALYDQLTGTLSATNAMLRRLQNPNGTFGRLVEDPTLYENLARATASLDSLAGALTHSEGTVGRLLRDDSLYVRLVTLTTGADSLVRVWYGGNGLVPRLVNDRQLYERVNKTLTDLNAMLEDIRRNPQKHFKGLVKVF